MSEKDQTDFDSQERDEFLKKNVKMRRVCPQCRREYEQEDILFCYYDGQRLIQTNEPPQIQAAPVQRMSPIAGDFSGFELNLQNASHSVPIPIELIQSTTRFMQTNPKMPSDSDNVQTWFWAIPSPKKKRNFLSKFINHVGFSRTNLASYFFCYLLIIFTYALWVAQIQPDLLSVNSLTDPNFLGLAVVTTIYTLVILILPIVSLGYTATDIMQANRKDFYLRVEPIILIMALVLNYLIFRFTGPIPILIIPGEPKIRGTPPTEHVVKSLKKSIYPSVVLAVIGFTGFAFTKYYQYGTALVQMNFEIMALFGLTILLFELLPFGNFIGKILLKHDATMFSISLLLVVVLLMTSISLSSI